VRLGVLAASIALVGTTLSPIAAGADELEVSNARQAASLAAAEPALVIRTPLQLPPEWGEPLAPTSLTRQSVVVAQELDQAASAIGFEYQADGPVEIRLRVLEPSGWSDWLPVGLPDGGPDPGSDEARRAAEVNALAVTEPLLTDRARAFEARISTAGEWPTSLTALTIAAQQAPTDVAANQKWSTSSLQATGTSLPAPAPAIISRSEWGADERLRLMDPDCAVPDYDSTIKVGFVHHTASTNNYDSSGAFSEVRAIYAYHAQALGWCDIGYNFLVDKFGRIFEGRWGGVDMPVHGAHTGGFNTDTFSVSALGNYQTAAAPDAMVNSIAQVLGWKLGLHNRQVFGQTTLVSAGGGTSRYPAGVPVTLNVVSGHRDVGATACPGRNLYSQLGRIRSIGDSVSRQTYTRLGEVVPAVGQAEFGRGSVRFQVFVPSATPYEVRIIDDVSGAVVRQWDGYAERGMLEQSWDLRNAIGEFARPGLFRWHLTTAVGGVAGAGIEITSPGFGLDRSGEIQRAGFVPIRPVRVYDSRVAGQERLEGGQSRHVRVLGIGEIPRSGVAGVAVNVTSVGATAASHLIVWPAGLSRPETSSLNTGPGESIAGLVASPVGVGGSLAVFNNAGRTDVLVDVVGYFPDEGGATLKTMAPTRILDGWVAAMSPGEERTLDIATAAGVSRSSLAGAVLNVTVSDASLPGHIRIAPPGSDADTSTANVVLGRDIANRTFAATSNGYVSVRNFGGTVRVYVDLVGYLVGGAGGAKFTSVQPTRLLDTRLGLGWQEALGGHEVSHLRIAGIAGVPASPVAVMGTFTSDLTTRPTHLRVWAKGAPLPGTSDLNPWPGSATANAAILAPGSQQSVSVYNDAGKTDVLFDVTGFFD
jgi:hypothetical protein